MSSEYDDNCKIISQAKIKAGKSKTNSKQKFAMGAFVRVTNNMPARKSHFDCGFVGVVAGSYAQLYGQSSEAQYREYSLIKLDREGYPVNNLSWYDQDELELLDNDVVTGLQIIRDFRSIIKKRKDTAMVTARIGGGEI